MHYGVNSGPAAAVGAVRGSKTIQPRPYQAWHSWGGHEVLRANRAAPAEDWGSDVMMPAIHYGTSERGSSFRAVDGALDASLEIKRLHVHARSDSRS